MSDRRGPSAAPSSRGGHAAVGGQPATPTSRSPVNVNVKPAVYDMEGGSKQGPGPPLTRRPGGNYPPHRTVSPARRVVTTRQAEPGQVSPLGRVRAPVGRGRKPSPLRSVSPHLVRVVASDTVSSSSGGKGAHQGAPDTEGNHAPPATEAKAPLLPKKGAVGATPVGTAGDRGGGDGAAQAMLVRRANPPRPPPQPPPRAVLPPGGTSGDLDLDASLWTPRDSSGSEHSSSTGDDGVPLLGNTEGGVNFSVRPHSESVRSSRHSGYGADEDGHLMMMLDDASHRMVGGPLVGDDESSGASEVLGLLEMETPSVSNIGSALDAATGAGSQPSDAGAGAHYGRDSWHAHLSGGHPYGSDRMGAGVPSILEGAGGEDTDTESEASGDAPREAEGPPVVMPASIARTYGDEGGDALAAAGSLAGVRAASSSHYEVSLTPTATQASLRSSGAGGGLFEGAFEEALLLHASGRAGAASSAARPRFGGGAASSGLGSSHSAAGASASTRVDTRPEDVHLQLPSPPLESPGSNDVALVLPGLGRAGASAGSLGSGVVASPTLAGSSLRDMSRPALEVDTAAAHGEVRASRLRTAGGMSFESIGPSVSLAEGPKSPEGGAVEGAGTRRQGARARTGSGMSFESIGPSISAAGAGWENKAAHTPRVMADSGAVPSGAAAGSVGVAGRLGGASASSSSASTTSSSGTPSAVRVAAANPVGDSMGAALLAVLARSQAAEEAPLAGAGGIPHSGSGAHSSSASASGSSSASPSVPGARPESRKSALLTRSKSREEKKRRKAAAAAGASATAAEAAASVLARAQGGEEGEEALSSPRVAARALAAFKASFNDALSRTMRRRKGVEVMDVEEAARETGAGAAGPGLAPHSADSSGDSKGVVDMPVVRAVDSGASPASAFPTFELPEPPPPRSAGSSLESRVEGRGFGGGQGPQARPPAGGGADAGHIASSSLPPRWRSGPGGDVGVGYALPPPIATAQSAGVSQREGRGVRPRGALPSPSGWDAGVALPSEREGSEPARPSADTAAGGRYRGPITPRYIPHSVAGTMDAISKAFGSGLGGDEEPGWSETDSDSSFKSADEQLSPPAYAAERGGAGAQGGAGASGDPYRKGRRRGSLEEGGPLVEPYTPATKDSIRAETGLAPPPRRLVGMSRQAAQLRVGEPRPRLRHDAGDEEGDAEMEAAALVSPQAGFISPIALGTVGFGMPQAGLMVQTGTALAAIPASQLIFRPPPEHAGIVLCYIVRDKSSSLMHPTYTLYRQGRGGDQPDEMMLCARKQRRGLRMYFSVCLFKESLDREGDANQVGTVASNFMGSRFTVHDHGRTLDEEAGTPPATSRVLAGVSYASTATTAVGSFRHMTVAVPRMHAGGPGGFQTGSLAEEWESMPVSDVHLLASKPPIVRRVHGQVRYYCRFGGRVKKTSVKNFQLIEQNGNPDRIIMQFGKVSDDLFVMDYRYPLSGEQAFGIALTSLDSKLCFAI